MLFNSFQFLIFFPTVVAVFFVLPQRFRWILLLAASYYFYMAWEPKYAVLILASTAIDYFAALGMERFQKDDAKRKLFLYASIAGNLGMLFFFKYFNFFSESVSTLLQSFNILYQSPALHLLLPIGISFYIFQSLSYTIDVYRGARSAERHFGIFALYVSFFPQLVAGPIERSTRLLPQFYRPVLWNSERVVRGLRLMLWGYFLKVVIADNSGIIVNSAYGDPHAYGGLALMIATFFFAMQIFGDFAGYSYIAIGAARIMGYDLMTNFRRPYFAASIGEFWRRWHISLMTWFRDYLYIPLGGSRATTVRWVRNISLVFLVSGLWHGANWTFIIWGALNGLYIILSRLARKPRETAVRIFHLRSVPRIHLFLQISATFLFSLFAWVFFRAETLSDALFIVSRIANDFGEAVFQLFDISALTDVLISLGMTNRVQFVALVGAILIMVGVAALEEWGRFEERFARLPGYARFGMYYALIVYIVFFGFIEAQPFFYFQF